MCNQNNECFCFVFAKLPAKMNHYCSSTVRKPDPTAMPYSIFLNSNPGNSIDLSVQKKWNRFGYIAWLKGKLCFYFSRTAFAFVSFVSYKRRISQKCLVFVSTFGVLHALVVGSIPVTQFGIFSCIWQLAKHLHTVTQINKATHKINSKAALPLHSQTKQFFFIAFLSHFIRVSSGFHTKARREKKRTW